MSEISNLGETLRTVIPSSVRTGLPAYPSYASGYVSPIAQAKGSLLPTALKGAAPSSGGGMLNNVVLGLKAKWWLAIIAGVVVVGVGVSIAIYMLVIRPNRLKREAAAAAAAALAVAETPDPVIDQTDDIGRRHQQEIDDAYRLGFRDATAKPAAKTKPDVAVSKKVGSDEKTQNAGKQKEAKVGDDSSRRRSAPPRAKQQPEDSGDDDDSIASESGSESSGGETDGDDDSTSEDLEKVVIDHRFDDAWKQIAETQKLNEQRRKGVPDGHLIVEDEKTTVSVPVSPPKKKMVRRRRRAAASKKVVTDQLLDE